MARDALVADPARPVRPVRVDDRTAMNSTPLFRMTWARTAPARPLTQSELGPEELRLGLHGPGSQQLKKSHHEDLPGDPWYLWSGTCVAPWAVSLRHRRWRLDLRGDARVVVRTRQTGAARLRLIIASATGEWRVSDATVGASDDWREQAIVIAETGWRPLAIDTIEATAADAAIDLAAIDAIGVADLQEAPRAGGDCVRLDWLEFHGVARERPPEAVEG